MSRTGVSWSGTFALSGVALFPEGARSTHRNQLPFHSGVVMLAALADVPVVMVYIDGPHKILRKRAKLISADRHTAE